MEKLGTGLKNRHLQATSRSIMIEGTKILRERFGGSFKDSVENEGNNTRVEEKSKKFFVDRKCQPNRLII